jgi:hypothetical protein
LQSVEKLVDSTGDAVGAIGRWSPPIGVDRPRMARATCGAEELRGAIDHGELINHYQPTVSPATGGWWASKLFHRQTHARSGPGPMAGRLGKAAHTGTMHYLNDLNSAIEAETGHNWPAT